MVADYNYRNSNLKMSISKYLLNCSLQIIEQNRKEILDLKTKVTDTINELSDVKEDLFKY